ncbi:HAD domain-containing protein [Streptomyces sp. NPDC086549]|uniref:HAD domain-containing protein n=1 Tax=Streptomyces sp. NPDC086549 TaxID=3365752 RepID=UPI0038039D52
MLLFLDVDGPLIPFGATNRPYPVYEAAGVPPEAAAGHPLLSRIDPSLGPRLAALGCELVWATTWMDDANTVVSPWLGLPPLPVVEWPDEDAPPALLHWKTRPLVAWAAGRPFVWLDDEITEADRAWVAAHHRRPALLHRVEHSYGITDADFTTVTQWLRTNGRTAGP